MEVPYNFQTKSSDLICLMADAEKQLFMICHSITSYLTPKEPRPFFVKNQGHFSQKDTPNLPFLAQEAQMNFFSLFCTFNCRILP
jgi:hypothetical protein